MFPPALCNMFGIFFDDYDFGFYCNDWEITLLDKYDDNYHSSINWMFYRSIKLTTTTTITLKQGTDGFIYMFHSNVVIDQHLNLKMVIGCKSLCHHIDIFNAFECIINIAISSISQQFAVVNDFRNTICQSQSVSETWYNHSLTAALFFSEC